MFVAVEPKFDLLILSGRIVLETLSCFVSSAFIALSITAVGVNNGMSFVVSTQSRNRSAQTVHLIEIIGQKNIELFAGFVALLGENKCGLVRLLITNVTDHVAVLEPLSICEAAIAF